MSTSMAAVDAPEASRGQVTTRAAGDRLGREDLLCSLHFRGDKVFLLSALRKYLEECIHEEMAAIR